MASLGHNELTHWGRVTHICVSKLTIIGSDNGLSPGAWRQAIIWTNAGILLIRTLGTNFSEILSTIHAFSSNKMHLKMSSAKWSPFCLGLNVLRFSPYSLTHCSVDKLVDDNIIFAFYIIPRYWVIPGCSNSLSRISSFETYCQISNISCTKSQNLNASHLVLQLSLPNPLTC